MNLKSFSTIQKATHQTDSRKQSLFNNKPKLDFLATEVSLSLRKPQTGEGEGANKQPVFSSPTSSVASFVDICPSWKNISRIAASDTDVNKLSSKEVFELSQTERKSPATFCFRPTDTVIMSHFSKLPRKIEDKGLFRS